MDSDFRSKRSEWLGTELMLPVFDVFFLYTSTKQSYRTSVRDFIFTSEGVTYCNVHFWDSLLISVYVSVARATRTFTQLAHLPNHPRMWNSDCNKCEGFLPEFSPNWIDALNLALIYLQITGTILSLNADPSPIHANRSASREDGHYRWAQETQTFAQQTARCSLWLPPGRSWCCGRCWSRPLNAGRNRVLLSPWSSCQEITKDKVLRSQKPIKSVLTV